MIDHHRIFKDEPRAWAPGYLVMECDVLVKPFPDDALLVARESIATATIKKAMRRRQTERKPRNMKDPLAVFFAFAVLAMFVGFYLWLTGAI